MRVRLAIGLAAAISFLAGTVTPAASSVTLGQISTPPSMTTCGNNLDFVQASITSGNSYTVPGNGTITSWTTLGGLSSPQRTLKVFRKVGDPARFQAVGHDGPRTLTDAGPAENTFPASIQVQAGDLLGFRMVNAGSCFFDAGGQPFLTTVDVQDGQAEDFGPVTDRRLELEAVFVPDSSFTLARTQRNKKKGTATLSFSLPNPGVLTGTGKGAKVSIARSGPVGGVAAPNTTPSQLLVKAKGKNRKALEANGKVTLKVKVTYTPTGGDANTMPLKVKLKKKKRQT
jgi:hypothetical protein